MAITKRYEYLPIKKISESGSRKYVTPDGFAVPSVTTILDATKTEETKQALDNWRKRVGYKKANQITTEAASRGTRMHKWLEDYITHDKIGDPGSNPYSKQSQQMAKIIIDKGISKCNEFWGIEVSLYFPEVYAGTTDLVGIHDKTPAIMDHKQTNKPKKREWIEDYFIQVAAYSQAHNEVYNTKIRKGVIFMCSQDFQYQEFMIEGNEFDKYVDLWYKKLEEYYTKFL